MRHKQKLQAYLTLILTGMSFMSLAITIKEPTVVDEFVVLSNERISIPDTCISLINKKFNFDWADYKTIPNSIAMISEVEKHLNKNTNYTKLSKADKESLGVLLIKLGAYYAFITQQNDVATNKLNQAVPFLSKKNDIAWNNILLAYAFSDKYSMSEQRADKDKALYYINKVLTQFHPQQQNQPQVAFAHYVQGMIQNSDNDIWAAELSYKKALDIFTKIKAANNNQYFMAKKALDNTLLNQKSRENVASEMLNNIGYPKNEVRMVSDENTRTTINCSKTPFVYNSSVCIN